MKILILGANGQVGRELQRSLSTLGEIQACDLDTVDFENLDELQACVRDYQPTIIVNAAAYTSVDQAESAQEKAYAINCKAVELLANEARQLNAWLIHYSTDYVFDGDKEGRYSETHEPNPKSVYGKTKLQGDIAIQKSGCQHIIFRTSWVYSSHGSNFAKTMIKLAQERDELNIVADQTGVPTSAELIADVTALCLYKIKYSLAPTEKLTGIYNLVPTGETSWHGFAQYLINEAQHYSMAFRTTAENIHPISTDEYPLPAKRPANSRLDTQKLINTFNVYLPPWEYHVKRLVSELMQKEAQ